MYCIIALFKNLDVLFDLIIATILYITGFSNKHFKYNTYNIKHAKGQITLDYCIVTGCHFFVITTRG